MWEATSVMSTETDLSKVCRTCMNESEDLMFMFDYYGKYDNRPLCEMFTTCTQIEVNKDDGLPVKMCSKCSHCVEEAYSFRLQAERCNSMLRNIVTSKATSNNTHTNFNIKQEIVKDEISDYDGGDYVTYHSDDSDDTQPLSSIKKQRVVLYNCKFCDFNSAVEDEILSHLVGSHRGECGVEGGRTRGRPSQQELAERKMKIQPLLDNFVTTTDSESKVEVKMELDNNDATCDNEQIDFNNLEGGSESVKKVKKNSKHKKDKSHMCDVCGKGFCKTGHLQRHKRKFHTIAGGEEKEGKISKVEKKEKTFVCGTCSKAFYRQEQLDRHHRTHLPREKKYHCPDCPKQYDRPDKLKFHSRVHVANKAELESNFLCVYCGHGFSNSSNLIVHLRRHTGEKPYRCDICQKGFPRSTDLQNHRIIHTGERPCVCKVCGKAFSHQHKLVRHERIHTGHKPFKCTLCERAFTQSNDLTLHIRRHTGDKPYVCTVCGDRFYLNTVLQAHKRTHGHYDAKEQAAQALQAQQGSVT